jgi:5'-nucleotidase
MKSLAEYYIPIEHNMELTIEERTAAVTEWYTEAHQRMLDEKLSFSRLDEIVSECWKNFEIHLRDECTDLFVLCKIHGIPITVLSAGLRNVIELILTKENILDCQSQFDDDEAESPVMVVANRMHFVNDVHVGFSEPIIHAMNKKGALHEFLVSSRTRSCRPNALVMGDLIADVDFVHSIPNLEEYIAIGFLCDSPDNSESLVQKYLEHFDVVVLGGSASMGVPIEIIKALVLAN